MSIRPEDVLGQWVNLGGEKFLVTPANSFVDVAAIRSWARDNLTSAYDRAAKSLESHRRALRIGEPLPQYATVKDRAENSSRSHEYDRILRETLKIAADEDKEFDLESPNVIMQRVGCEPLGLAFLLHLHLKRSDPSKTNEWCVEFLSKRNFVVIMPYLMNVFLEVDNAGIDDLRKMAGDNPLEIPG